MNIERKVHIYIYFHYSAFHDVTNNETAELVLKVLPQLL